jgi:Protein of unknown function (DUF1488)
MDVLIHKQDKTSDSRISFPSLQCLNPITNVATIAAQYSGRRVSCKIKIEDLSKKFNTTADQPMELVTQYRTEIESAARRLIDKKAFEKDGSIMISSKDL